MRLCASRPLRDCVVRAQAEAVAACGHRRRDAQRPALRPLLRSCKARPNCAARTSRSGRRFSHSPTLLRASVLSVNCRVDALYAARTHRGRWSLRLSGRRNNGSLRRCSSPSAAICWPHGFICKFRKLDPSATPSEASAFAAKTVAFLAHQLHAAYPSVPIYFALGNNDSGCGDYFETPDSAFLKSAAVSLAASIHDPEARASFAASFPRFGDYSVMLPAPMSDTRLIVLQNIFESAHYRGCNGEPNAAPAAEQIAWLRKQFTAGASKRRAGVGDGAHSAGHRCLHYLPSLPLCAWRGLQRQTASDVSEQ